MVGQLLRSYSDLTELVRQHQAQMPESYRRLATHVLQNYQEVAFMTATELGMAVEMSQPTVTRFATFLGFDGYPQFVKALQNIVRMELKGTDRLRFSSRPASDSLSRYDEILQQEAAHIERLKEVLESPTFKSAVTAISEAETVVVTGARIAMVLVQYLAFFLNKVRPGVIGLPGGDSSVLDQIAGLNPKTTVMVGMAFPRYPTEFLNILRYGSQLGFKIVCLTDSLVSPVVRMSHLTLIAPINLATLFDSYTAPMALINLLIDGVGQANPKRTEQRLAQLEEMYGRQQVFHSGG